MKYFINNCLFSERQFGFMKGRSTVTQLLTVLDKWTRLLDGGEGQIVVYTDLEKAFDKVPHKFLVNKLKSYGVGLPFIKWIESFLVARKQRVRVGNGFSDWSKVESGIPQGTVLGPFLFIVYINDMVKFDQYDSTIFLYADDTKNFKYITHEDDVRKLQDDLEKIVQWLNNSMLKLNVVKCKVVSYGRKIEFKNNYTINNIKLERVDNIKDLGVIRLSVDHIRPTYLAQT